MKIIKTGSNPQRSLSIIQEPIKLLDSVDKLILEANEEAVVLPGLTDKSSLENSDITTVFSAREIDDTGSFTNPPTATEILTAQRTERLNLSAPFISSHGNFTIAPFGLSATGASILGGLSPRVELALPSVKLAKFLAMEQVLRNNMELTSARQVVLAQIVSRNVRVAHMYAAASAFALPFVFLRRVINNVRVAINHLAEIGVGDVSIFPFNDEEIQTTIAQLANLVFGLPVLDPEMYDRINTILEPTYTMKRAIARRTLEILDCNIAVPSNAIYTSAGSPLTGAPIEDSYMHTSIAYLRNTLPSSFDNCIHITALADALFQPTATSAVVRAQLRSYIQDLLTWASSVKSTYRDYLQYIAFAESKSWLTLKRTSEFIKELSVSADGELVIDASAPFVYSHSKQILRDYIPFVQFIEGTANNAWARVHAPMLITSNGAVAASSLSAQSILRKVDKSNVADNVHGISELASWGIWVKNDSSASSTSSETDKVYCINPYDALHYMPTTTRFVVNVGNGNVTLTVNTDTQFIFFTSDLGKLNTMFVKEDVAFGGAGSVRTEWNDRPNADAEASTTIMFHMIGRRRFRLAGFNRSLLRVNNTAGNMEAALVDVENYDYSSYVELPLLDFIKQCNPYYNASLFDVQPLKQK